MRTIPTLIAMAIVAVTASATVHSAEKSVDWISVRPTDNNQSLENPGMGWVFHHYDNGLTGYGEPLGPAYDGREFPGLTVVYLRLAWSHLEPVEGQFNWSILDTPIQRYAAAGKRFAFRFTVFEGDTRQGTPEWVRAAGAQGHLVETFGTTSWEPDYDDPVFLEKLERFLRAAGEKYNGHPRLAFVDVGTLGIWGEGHPIARPYELATLRRHIAMHREAFPAALLVAQDDWIRYRVDSRQSTHVSRREHGPGAFDQSTAWISSSFGGSCLARSHIAVGWAYRALGVAKRGRRAMPARWLSDLDTL